MSVTVEEFKRIKAKVETRRKEADRAEGAFQEAVKRLNEQGFDSIKAAEVGLKQLDDQLADAEVEYEDQLLAFKDKWGSILS
jgi:hypothetical protein